MITNLGFIVGVVALAISIAAIIILFHDRSHKRDRAVIEIGQQITNYIDQHIKEISKTAIHRPGLELSLTTQWRFIEKLYNNRFAKAQIARCIAQNHVLDGDVLFLDSGSTTDLITSELLAAKKEKILIHSNNLFAAIHLVGVPDQQFFLLPGKFNDRFAAVYSKEAQVQLDRLGINLFILAATKITWEDGMMMQSDDAESLEFKAHALEAFANNRNARLVIAADMTKYVANDEKGHGILDQKKWISFREKHKERITIVTSSSKSQKLSPEQQVAAEEEINKFSSKGIRVDYAKT